MEVNRDDSAESELPLRTTDPESGRPESTVVGIGASAGGLAALREFFDRVPENSGLAFVVVVHLSPDHESHLDDLLQPHVKMPVRQVTETMPLEPDRVYVIPPNANLNTIDTHLRLSELEEKRHERAPIDHFFRTLAETHGGHAICVILTGTGSDGTLGLKEVKGRGGLAIVQDPKEAAYDGMPQSAIATGLVDFVLPLARMPEVILRFARTRPRVRVPADGGDLNDNEERLLQKIFAHLMARRNCDFSRYKRSTIMRRIRRRMQMHQIEELGEYLDLLRKESEEARTLADDLLITVTSFFRDREAFTYLEEEIVPKLFEGKEADDEVRVWSVGCATGEEAYSLAMLLMEEASRYEAPPKIHVFASDLHEPSLEKARDGFYPGDIESEVSPKRLRRFFRKDDGGYRIRKEVRELVVFAPHNVLNDPPFSRLDLISCRNLMIYLQRDVQRDVAVLFHYALRPDGFLLLGSSETLERSELFMSVEKEHCIYAKRNVPPPEPRLAVFPMSTLGPHRQRARPKPEEEPIAYGRLHQRIVEQYGPPSMLVSPDDQVVHLSRHAGRYLVHPGGEPTHSAFKVVRKELRIELRSAIHAARERGESTRSVPIPVRFDGSSSPVVLDVRPALEPEHQGFILVIFEERSALDADVEKVHASGDGHDVRVRELEAELDMTRNRLESIIEEYATSQEEMKASNEELLSANEELRSTMEELETSKEELQSMNEELQTVNQENRHKVEELAQLSGDLQNLLTATDIATLFLDRDLRILRFTPRVGDLFNVRMTDRGRPIADLTHRLGYDQLQVDATAVLDRLVPVDREVRDDEGRWYLTRVLPYRSAQDRIEGVVITFIDITERKKAEEALRESEERYRLLVESAKEYAIFVLDVDGSITTWNAGAERLFGYDEEEAIGVEGSIIFTEEDRKADVPATEMELARRNGTASGERWHVRKDGSRFWASGAMELLQNPDGSPRGFLNVLRDNTERKEAEEALRRANETLEQRVEDRTREVRSLASKLTMAEQEERRRISQILHDDLQQVLYAVNMKISRVRDSVRSADAADLEESLEKAEMWMERTISTTKRLTVDLSPPILEGEGLVDALRWLEKQMMELHGLNVQIEAEHNWHIPDEDLRVLLFQVVRELLFNVTKHSGAERAVIRLVEEEGRLVIHVVDGGRGFDVDAVQGGEESATGFGLFRAQERLQLLGGHLEVRSQPDKGTHIEVYTPIARESYGSRSG